MPVYGDVSIVDLEGRSTIYGGESKLLGKHLRDLAANGKRKLLLNLANLTQMDSSGIGIITWRAEIALSTRPGASGIDCVSPSRSYSQIRR